MDENIIGKGFSVFPCKKDEKIPAIKDWPHKGSKNKADIEEWLDLAVVNYGIITGAKLPNDKYLAVVDVDNKEGPKGSITFETITAGIPAEELSTFTVSTPNKGYHYYFSTDEPIKNSVNVDAGIDIRGKGGFVVGFGSSINGIRYTITNNTDIKPMPTLLYKSIIGLSEKKLATTTSEQQVNGNLGSEEAKSIEVGSRNSTLFTAASTMKMKGFSQETAMDIITSMNAKNCKDPLDVAEVSKLVESAYSYITNSGYQLIEPTAAIELLDRKGYFIAGLADKTFVWEAFKDNKIEYWNRSTFKSFKEKYINIEVDIDKKRPIPIGDYWIKNTTKRYDYALFNPSKAPEYVENGKMIKNLWEGFSIPTESHEHASDLFIEFIKETICNNNIECYEYLMDWLASIIQYPADKIGRGVTIVLEGSHGIGKGFFGNSIGRLFGKAYAYINFDEYALKDFNGTLENRLLCFFDEVIWSGDRKKANLVKSLITETRMEIRKMYTDSYGSNNYTRFILATNNEGEGAYIERTDERRFLVLKVSDKHKSDNRYFEKLQEALDNNGFEDLLHVLANRDISRRSFEKIPLTEAKKETVFNSLGTLEQWLVSKVQDGYIPDKNGITRYEFEAHPELVTDQLFDAYESDTKGSKDSLSKQAFILRLKKILPSMKSERDHAGTHFRLPATKDAIKDIKEKIGFEI